MKKFLTELEACLAKAEPSERVQIVGAYQALVRAVSSSTSIIGGKFKPSKGATLGVLVELGSALGGGGGALIAKLKRTAPAIGPHVSALVQAL